MKSFGSKFFILTMAIALFSSCSRSSSDVWEDSKTASRYAGKSVRSLFGKHGDSREVRSQEEFLSRGPQDFIPLEDEEIQRQLSGNYESGNIPHSRENPGEAGSDIPGIDGFSVTTDDPELAKIFQRIHFPYNSSLVKGEENLRIIKNIANYHKAHPNAYFFVEGHCDERGSAAYNLALGTRRSNAIREVLVKEGVNPDHVFTISYGKEKPLVKGFDEVSWGKNRRGEFRLFKRNSGAF